MVTLAESWDVLGLQKDLVPWCQWSPRSPLRDPEMLPDKGTTFKMHFHLQNKRYLSAKIIVSSASEKKAVWQTTKIRLRFLLYGSNYKRYWKMEQVHSGLSCALSLCTISPFVFSPASFPVPFLRTFSPYLFSPYLFSPYLFLWMYIQDPSNNPHDTYL